MAITIERDGQRFYFLGDTYPVKGRIKAMGGHWDGDRRAWWVGAKKEAEARALADELATPAQKAAVGMGMQADTPAGVVADALDEAGKAADAQAVRDAAGAPKQQRPASEVRLTGKGTYQGRSYYLGPQTKDGARVLILGLPKPDGSYFEHWVPAAEVQVTKTYQPREVWDGRRYSGRTRTVYQTLGGIADFIARENRNRTSGGAVCAACGKSGELVQDIEDGLMKHRHCCDIEA